MVLAVILVAAFGIADETLQTLIPGRTGADIGDWIADVLGAAAGALASIPTQRRLHRRPPA
jgi:VanZ family protein